MRSTHYLYVPAFLALAVWLVPVPAAMAAQSYDNCTGFIDSIPATITTQGVWCMRHDLATNISSGVAITVANNNVTLDCNNFKLGGLGAGPATNTVGIHSFNRIGITVRQCNVRGFMIGVDLSADSDHPGGGHLVEDNVLQGNTSMGIELVGDGSLVRNNRLIDTGGSTLAIGHAYAIYAAGAVDVVGNSISGVLPVADQSGNADAVGIINAANPSGRTIGNGISGLAALGSGSATAIWNNASDRVTVRDNDLVGPGVGDSVGVLCTPASSTRTLGNVINGFNAGISACADDGNIIAP